MTGTWDWENDWADIAVCIFRLAAHAFLLSYSYINKQPFISIEEMAILDFPLAL